MEQAQPRHLEKPRTHCAVCDSEVVEGSMCPWSVACPVCDAQPKYPCNQLGTHRAAMWMHAARYDAAQLMDLKGGV